MAETVVETLGDEERRASDRRKAAVAARLLNCCLGIAAEPSFDLSCATGRASATVKDIPLGDGMYKDVFDFGAAGEMPELQLLVVDEDGRIKAESKQMYTLGEGLALLGRLPLPLSPWAERWVKDCLGEAGPARGRPILAPVPATRMEAANPC